MPRDDNLPASISVLLEEYRQLYEIVRFRLSALDQRVPLAGVALIGALASISSISEFGQLVLLIALPVSVLWWLSTTLTHVRSFEDTVRRIEAIELAINERCGANLMTFQHSHPGRHLVGGRTGRETVQAVLAASAVLLAGCGSVSDHVLMDNELRAAYWSVVACVAATLLLQSQRLKSYGYQPYPITAR